MVNLQKVLLLSQSVHIFILWRKIGLPLYVLIKNSFLPHARLSFLILSPLEVHLRKATATALPKKNDQYISISLLGLVMLKEL